MALLHQTRWETKKRLRGKTPCSVKAIKFINQTRGAHENQQGALRCKRCQQIFFCFGTNIAAMQSTYKTVLSKLIAVKDMKTGWGRRTGVSSYHELGNSLPKQTLGNYFIVQT